MKAEKKRMCLSWLFKEPSCHGDCFCAGSGDPAISIRFPIDFF